MATGEFMQNGMNDIFWENKPGRIALVMQ